MQIYFQTIFRQTGVDIWNVGQDTIADRRNQDAFVPAEQQPGAAFWQPKISDPDEETLLIHNPINSLQV